MARYEDCVKIHEGCGGLVRWVEAVDTPGVQWQGECLHCHSERLVIEEILPLKMRREDVPIGDIQTLRELEWNDETTWQNNQERISEELA
jgi:hypothetical protein